MLVGRPLGIDLEFLDFPPASSLIYSQYLLFSPPERNARDTRRRITAFPLSLK